MICGMTTTATPRPAACTCGAADLASCLCGTTAGDWAAASRQPAVSDGTRERTPITTGDRVRVIAYGYGAGRGDVGFEGTVTGFTASRVRVDLDNSDSGPGARRLAASVLKVLR